MKRREFPRLAYNWVSMIGAVIAVFAITAIIFLLITTLISGITKPYMGILLYLGLPTILVAGLLLIPIGMYIRWRAWKKSGGILPSAWPSIDFNNRRHRNAAMIFISGTVLFVFISSIGIYQTYQYTGSTTFCGKTCHKVMSPQYTTYHNSPHSRVKCVECHIGPGASWYVKAKLSGLYQVYATIANVYPRPIPIPIKDLMPVKTDCKQCHWPKRFVGAQLVKFDQYLYDKANTPWHIDMLLKTGGKKPGSEWAGIHWHTSTNVRVEYIARDKQKQDIPWVKVINKKTGNTTVYQDIVSPLSKKEIKTLKIRTMDCVDCHNQPSHSFHSPDYEIDRAIAAERLNSDIPSIKQVSVNAMNKKYKSDAEAMKGITNSITDFYRTNYPVFYSQKKKTVNNAIKAVKAAFHNSIFPAMKVRWSVYPNNIGHFYSRGCMRCHDGNHKSKSGAVIPNNCTTCHTILLQGRGESSEVLVNLSVGEKFRHPVNIEGAWKTGVCYMCHTGVQP